MARVRSSGSANPDGVSRTTIREIVAGAARFWEPRRVPYNGVLVVVVLA